MTRIQYFESIKLYYCSQKMKSMSATSLNHTTQSREIYMNNLQISYDDTGLVSHGSSSLDRCHAALGKILSQLMSYALIFIRNNIAYYIL